MAVSGNLNLTSNASSANLTNLEQDTQYDVTVSPYIDGFQLGPPTNIIINTSSLGNFEVCVVVVVVCDCGALCVYMYVYVIYLHCIVVSITTGMVFPTSVINLITESTVIFEPSTISMSATTIPTATMDSKH